MCCESVGEGFYWPATVLAAKQTVSLHRVEYIILHAKNVN